MSTFIIPEEMASVLEQLKERTELRDASGNLVGLFTPQGEPETRGTAQKKPLFELEEAEQLWAAQRHLPGRSLKEIMNELEEAQRTSP